MLAVFIWSIAYFLHYFGSLQMMQQLYRECNLVHADLSEYNMLWHDGKVSLFIIWGGKVLSTVKH